MRASTWIAALSLSSLLAGCGGGDPCDGKSGACISLTVSSALTSKIDQLDITAFGSERSSTTSASSFPVKIAIIPPAGTTGEQKIDVEALLGGVWVGAGDTEVVVTDGHVAASVELFASGCQSPTPDDCSGVCVDKQSDPANCGQCGTKCTYPHAGATCSTGACQIGTCESGYGDCGGGPADGCEAYLPTDENNCGACGNKCLVGQLCVASQCKDNIFTCSSRGATCQQAGCSTGNFAVSAGGEIAVDLANNRRLWTRKSYGPSTQRAAHNDCLTLAVEGISGWRLPADFGEIPLNMPGGLNGCPTCNPAVDQAAFPDTTTSPGYWTDYYDATRMAYSTNNYCDGRNNYWTTPTDMMKYRCTHDPL